MRTGERCAAGFLEAEPVREVLAATDVAAGG
jgi:hypothetical protein